MCAAEVWRSPSPTSRYSKANSAPAAAPGCHTPLPTSSRSPRQAMSRPTSAAAMPDRTAICSTGEKSSAVALSTICCALHSRQSMSIRPVARASRGCRVSIHRFWL